MRTWRKGWALVAIAGAAAAVAACDGVLGIVFYPEVTEEGGTDGAASRAEGGPTGDGSVGVDATARDASGDVGGDVDGGVGDAREESVDALPPPAEAAARDAYAPVVCDGGGFQPTACIDDGGTTITGTIFDPAGLAPVPGAIVYVPATATPLTPLTHGPVTDCATCGDLANLPGCSATVTVTGADGTFTLTEAPSGSSLPLVVQLGRWRRQLVLPAIEPCVPNAIDPALTRLPGAQGPGIDMPRIAIATGCDQMECSLRRYGWADSEFTAADGGGSVNLYPGTEGSWVGEADGGEGGSPPGTLTSSALMSNASLLSRYDVAVFPCECSEIARSGLEQGILSDYLAEGGRALFNHFGYTWIYDNGDLMGAATWQVNTSNGSPDTTTAFVGPSSPAPDTLATWLYEVNASTTLGRVALTSPREDVFSVTESSNLWLSGYADGGVPLQFSAAIPIGDAGSCGRLHFLDYHVENGEPVDASAFPSECTGGVTSASQRVLEYTFFNLLSCP